MAIYQLTWNAPTTRTDGTELPAEQISGYVVRRVFDGLTNDYQTLTNSFLLDIGSDAGVGVVTVAAVDFVGEMSTFVPVPTVVLYNNLPVINTTVLASIAVKIDAVDADADPLTFSVQTPPAKGAVVVVNSNTGIFRYTPHAGQAGTDSFVVRASDGRTGGNADITVNVNLTNWSISTIHQAINISRS